MSEDKTNYSEVDNGDFFYEFTTIDDGAIRRLKLQRMSDALENLKKSVDKIEEAGRPIAIDERMGIKVDKEDIEKMDELLADTEKHLERVKEQFRLYRPSRY